MDKSPNAFRTISEVAEDLELPQHVLRFWETRFSHIKPLKRGGGRRYYRPDDIDLLKGIRHLLYGEGYTIRGVQRILKAEGVRFVQAIGRGEQSVAAPPRDEADAIEEEMPIGDGGLGSGREAPHSRTAPMESPSRLSRSSLHILQAALSDLLECERVLGTLRAPEPAPSE